MWHFLFRFEFGLNVAAELPLFLLHFFLPEAESVALARLAAVMVGVVASAAYA